MAVNVARIYEQTIRPGRSYCRICLRSAEETKLVPPKKIRQFTEALKLDIFEGKNGTVCYMCEAYADTALRIYQACVNAVSVKKVCKPLKNMKPNDAVPDSLRRSILECNANLKAYRKKTVMQQTEVLVVDSSGIEWQPEQGSTINEPTKIIAPPVPRQLTQQQQQQQYETVVLDDDDDETPAKNKTTLLTPPTVLPKLIPIETLLDPKLTDKSNLAALLPEQMQIISNHNIEENNFILHPVVVGEKGVLIAPSLGAQIINSQLVYNAKVYKPLPMIDCTDTNFVVKTSQNTTNSKLETLLKSNNSPNTRINTSYGSAQCSYRKPENENRKRTSDSSVSANKKRQLDKTDSDSQFVVDLDTINNMITNGEGPMSMLENNDESPIAVISNVTGHSEDPIAIISNVESTSDRLRGEKGVLKGVISRGPQLVEKNVKIDWEDKIPMDVISFVDSTDPADRELIVPDLPSGYRHAATQMPQQHAHQQKSNQVIDLC